MMMELGSEYNLSLNNLSLSDNSIFHYLSGFRYLHFFDSGRSALRHIAMCLDQTKTVLLPEYICESVTNCFQGMQITYYRLNDDFTIDFSDLKNKITSKTAAVFLMHYFGAVQPKETTVKLKAEADEHGFLIIEDTTHSIFSRTWTVGDYMVSSIRKWMPIPKGGVLYSRENRLNLEKPGHSKSRDDQRVYAMILKDLFLNNRLDCNTFYRLVFTECEKKLDEQEEILMISDLARFLASCINIQELKQKRQQNYRHLQNSLEDLGLEPAVRITDEDSPFVFPLRIPDRDRFRSFLMDHRIYCAVHWPFDGQRREQRPQAVRAAEELISLPIDQRYSESHMNYLAETISGYKGDLIF